MRKNCIYRQSYEHFDNATRERRQSRTRPEEVKFAVKGGGEPNSPLHEEALKAAHSLIVILRSRELRNASSEGITFAVKTEPDYKMRDHPISQLPIVGSLPDHAMDLGEGSTCSSRALSPPKLPVPCVATT